MCFEFNRVHAVHRGVQQELCRTLRLFIFHCCSERKSRDELLGLRKIVRVLDEAAFVKITRESARDKPLTCFENRRSGGACSSHPPYQRDKKPSTRNPQAAAIPKTRINAQLTT